MHSLIIKGEISLKGNINISGSKNAALPMMAASLLTDKLTLNNVPKLSDILTMKAMLEKIGSIITIIDYSDYFTMEINSSNITNLIAPCDIARKMRASIWVLGPLLARFSQADVSLPGGCAIGARQVDLHIEVLRAMGATIKEKNGLIRAKVNGRLKGVNFTFRKISVGATINALMAATLAEGETILYNCAQDPEIVDLCCALKNMGAMINGIGTNILKIIGKEHLNNAVYTVMADRIEAGTYMIAAAITKGDLNIYGIDYKTVENLALKLMEVGMKIVQIDNGLRISYVNRLKAVDVQTNTYPGFATDLQAQFMSLMTVCNGYSGITENIFENRFMHVHELCRMGADISVKGNKARVHGVPFLVGAEVTASDLRGSAALVLAGIAAQGQTIVHGIYHLDRGYQTMENKLNNCGASILRVKCECNKCQH